MIVLDASALLAFLGEESDGDKVPAFFSIALMSTLNLAEVLSKSAERGADPFAIADTLLKSPITFVEFSAGQALAAATLRPRTKAQGLSLGDRACFALAIERDCAVLTTDSIWTKVSVGVQVRLLRDSQS